jgi:hypothetical protein
MNTSAPAADVVADVERVLDGIESRAETIVQDAEGFLERHIAPDVAHVLAFSESALTNAAAFQAAVVQLVNVVYPSATPEVQEALNAIQAAAKDGNNLAAAFLAFLASKAPKSKTEPVTSR